MCPQTQETPILATQASPGAETRTAIHWQKQARTGTGFSMYRARQGERARRHSQRGQRSKAGLSASPIGPNERDSGFSQACHRWPAAGRARGTSRVALAGAWVEVHRASHR